YEPNIAECWGDGIIVTESRSNMREGVIGYPVVNVVVKGGVLDYNRRNGITVTSGTDLIFEGIHIVNTMGTAPKAGIMIEPDNAKAVLKNIIINNVKVANSPLGIGVNITKLSNNRKGNSISLRIENTSIENSLAGIQIAGFRERPQKKKISG